MNIYNENEHENGSQTDNKLQAHNINRPRPRHELKCTKYKKCLHMTMLICIKQHLNNMWNSIHEKLSNTEAELKKSVAYKKSVYLLAERAIFTCFKISVEWIFSPSKTLSLRKTGRGTVMKTFEVVKLLSDIQKVKLFQ